MTEVKRNMCVTDLKTARWYKPAPILGTLQTVCIGLDHFHAWGMHSICICQPCSPKPIYQLLITGVPPLTA